MKVESLGNPQLGPDISDISKPALPEPQPGEELLHEAALRLGERLRDGNYNIVIVSVGPEAKVGAGHERQALAMRRFLEGLGFADRITYISLKDAGGIFAQIYPLLQRYPGLYKRLRQILQNIKPRISDFFLKQRGRSDIVRKKLSLSPNTFNDKRPTIFICTHVIAALGVVGLINTGVFSGAIYEFLPDPWRGFSLAVMRSPVVARKYGSQHYVVVHDPETAEEYLRFNPGLNPSNILPLGTLSPVFLRGELKENPNIEIPHIGIEFSGNEIPEYTEKVLGIIRAMAEDLREEKIRLTIHTMWHEKTKSAIEEELEILGLKDKPNIRIIHDEDTVKALQTRQDYIIGDDEWPAPDIVITKGGEVCLEYRGRTLVVGIYGAGHEEDDVKAGVNENRALNMIDIEPGKVYERIKEELEKWKKEGRPLPPHSLAPLALLAHLDPDYFLTNILPHYCQRA